VLDRSSQNAITPADLAAHLSSLGLDSSGGAVAAYFPRGGGSTVSLAAYLGGLAADLARLSRREELLEAFAAFDGEDAGEVDVAEVRSALVGAGGSAPLTGAEVDRVMDGFVGRRLGKKGGVGGGLGGKSADVFRYGEFVSAIWGGVGAEESGRRH